MQILSVVLAAYLVTGALIAFALRRDLWPFSHYPMFSRSGTSKMISVWQIECSLGGRWELWQPRVRSLLEDANLEINQLDFMGPSLPEHLRGLIEHWRDRGWFDFCGSRRPNGVRILQRRLDAESDDGQINEHVVIEVAFDERISE